jgi:hypothetical protein
MDKYCIDLGYLLDNPSVTTLEGPEQHSAHCLLDVDVCNQSPYHILQEPLPGETLFTTGWQASDNALLINVGRQVGSCDTCTGNVETGMRMEVRGEVESVDPPVLFVESVVYLSSDAVGCPELISGISDGGGEGAPAGNVTADPDTGDEPGEEPAVDPTGEEPGEEPAVDPTGEEPAVDPTGEEPAVDPTGEETGEEPAIDPTGEEPGEEPAADETNDTPEAETAAAEDTSNAGPSKLPAVFSSLAVVAMSVQF